MYLVDYTPQAHRFLKSSHANLTERILQKIEALRIDPFPFGSEKLHGALKEFHRVRIGDYRVIYKVIPERKTIHVISIDDRKRVYRWIYQTLPFARIHLSSLFEHPTQITPQGVNSTLPCFRSPINWTTSVPLNLSSWIGSFLSRTRLANSLFIKNHPSQTSVPNVIQSTVQTCTDFFISGWKMVLFLSGALTALHSKA